MKRAAQVLTRHSLCSSFATAYSSSRAALAWYTQQDRAYTRESALHPTFEGQVFYACVVLFAVSFSHVAAIHLYCESPNGQMHAPDFSRLPALIALTCVASAGIFHHSVWRQHNHEAYRGHRGYARDRCVSPCAFFKRTHSFACFPKRAGRA